MYVEPFVTLELTNDCFCRYVPMFGEIEYDSNRQFCSIPIEEQLDALGRAVDSGKVSFILLLFLPTFFISCSA